MKTRPGSCVQKFKHVPYGAKRFWEWCNSCDTHLVQKISKGSEREKAKKEIRKEIEEK